MNYTFVLNRALRFVQSEGVTSDERLALQNHLFLGTSWRPTSMRLKKPKRDYVRVEII